MMVQQLLASTGRCFFFTNRTCWWNKVSIFCIHIWRSISFTRLMTHKSWLSLKDDNADMRKICVWILKYRDDRRNFRYTCRFHTYLIKVNVAFICFFFIKSFINCDHCYVYLSNFRKFTFWGPYVSTSLRLLSFDLYFAYAFDFKKGWNTVVSCFNCSFSTIRVRRIFWSLQQAPFLLLIHEYSDYYKEIHEK